MFVDASALVAILTTEPDHALLSARIEAADRCTTSAIAIWETTLRVTTKADVTVAKARSIVNTFLKDAAMEVVAIGAREADLATEAFARFGKRRHPAALNMGDCFAYACAKANKVPLLYVGNDFVQTDVNEELA
jgi:ribonuclease VapC